MPIPITLLVPTVQAGIRLYRTGDKALAQAVRDRAIALPAGSIAAFRHEMPGENISAAFRSDAGKAYLKAHPEVQQNLDRLDEIGLGVDDELKAGLETHAGRVLTGADLPDEVFVHIEASVMVRQWQDDVNRPPLPWERFALSLVDIGLEFIATNPGLLGVGSNETKLIQAIANAVSSAIPNDGDFGTREFLVQRVAGIVLRSGLQVISTNPKLVFDDKHLQTLVTNTTKPIIAAFPKEGAAFEDRVKWHEVLDSVLGPAASAAFETVAENPGAFLGEDFKTDEAVGAVTAAILKSIASTGLDKVASREGLSSLYKSVLGVVAEKPELFLGSAHGDTEKLLHKLFTSIATELKSHGPNFDRELGLKIVDVGLESLKSNIHLFVKVENDAAWEGVVQGVLGQVMIGLRGGLGKGGALENVFSTSQLIALARVFFVQVAKTPRMVAGSDAKEFHGIVSAVARAMAADDKLLLTSADWLQIVTVALEEAAANPGRLFKFDEADAGDHLAEYLVKGLLTHAAGELKVNRSQGGVLFGQTLRDAVITTLRQVASNAAGAKAHLTDDKIVELAKEITARVELNRRTGTVQDLGSKEWLAIYKALLSRALTTGDIPELVDENGKPVEDGEKLIKKILAS